MKRTFKRAGALFTALLLAVAMCIPAFAASVPVTGTPSADNKAGVQISGLNAGDEVTFYQIVKAKYDETGFSGYEAVEDASIELFDAEGKAIYPSAAQITELSKNLSGLESVGPVTVAEGATSVTQDLAAGEWMVIIKSADAQTIYNPMVVSVYYEDSEDGTLITGGEVAIGDDTHYNLTGQDAFAKKSDVCIDKKITGNTQNDVQTESGDDIAIGDTISFSISSTIPSYSEEYTKIVYNVLDTMDESLDLTADSIKVFVGGTEITDGFTVTTEAHGFKIEFAEDYIRGLANESDTARAVEVTYDAVLNSNATVNFDENNNKATIEFTNSPDENADAEKIDDETHQYTFEIDGNINGKDKEINRKGHELIKVNEKGEPEVVEWIDEGTEETEIEVGLAGAEFSLTYIKNNKGEDVTDGKVYTATTDTNGYFNGFTGLDAGTYELVETKAPEGYTLNAQKHTVVISATYNEDGTLATFTIEIDGKATSTYSATYEDGKVTEITTVGEPQTTFIKNVKLNNLPSTGGAGTYVLTIIGVAIFAFAMRMTFKNRKTEG